MKIAEHLADFADMLREHEDALSFAYIVREHAATLSFPELVQSRLDVEQGWQRAGSPRAGVVWVMRETIAAALAREVERRLPS